MCVDCVLASPRIAQVDPGDIPPSEVVLSQLRIDRLAPMSKFELCATETEAILPYLTGVKWDSA
jgi:hypothetical protein